MTVHMMAVVRKKRLVKWASRVLTGFWTVATRSTTPSDQTNQHQRLNRHYKVVQVVGGTFRKIPINISELESDSDA